MTSCSHPSHFRTIFVTIHPVSGNSVQLLRFLLHPYRPASVGSDENTADRQSPPSLPPTHLQDLAGALLPEGIHLLAGEANQQTVLRLMFRDVLHNIGHGLGDRNPLDRGLPPQLLGDGPLLLKVRSHDVHYGRL